VFDKIRKQVLEPKIFAVIARANNAAVLHQGVHFTLEEAFNAAGKRLVESGAAKLGQPIEMDLWSAIPAREVLTKLCEVDNVPIDTGAPMKESESLQISADASIATDDKIVSANPMVVFPVPPLTPKDIVMKVLISGGNLDLVAEANDLTEEEKQYVREQINKNKLNP
jgi:hypothetical protein